MVKYIILFGVFTFYSQITFAQSTTISGTVTDNFLQTKVHKADIVLNKRVKKSPSDDFRNENMKVDSAFTDSSGRFSFIVKDTGLYYLQVFAELPVQYCDTLFLEKDTIIQKTAYQSLLIEIPFHKVVKDLDIKITIYCPYNETKTMKVCPKCLKLDSICKIIYGLPAFPYDENGKLKEPVPCRLGGCVVQRCHPENFCKRCEIDF